MKRLERIVRRALTIVGVAAGAVVLPGVAVADQIARPPGAVDRRAYELVSLPDKSNSQIQSVSLPFSGGDRAVYDLFGGGPDSPSGFNAMYLATRTAAGWQSRTYLPPRSELLRNSYVVGATTPDLSAAVMAAFDSLTLSTTSPDELFVRVAGNQQTLLHTFPVYFGPDGADIVASDDLRHVFSNVPEPIDPSRLPGTPEAPIFNVYDFASGTPQLVSRLPGTGLAPACGVAEPSDATVPAGFATGGSQDQHWASTDGSRAFFLTAGDGAPDCTGPIELYLRDLTAAATTTVSGPPVAGDLDNGVDRFLGATPDGSQVFYRTATSLDLADDADADASDLDIYRWSAATGHNACLTCSAPHAQVSGFRGTTNALVSEDGSHVYFTSPNQLADAPAPGTVDAPNLYVWRLHHSLLHFVAQVNGVTAQLIFGGQTTPDGHVLIFRSNQPGLDLISGGSNGGFFQYYRYDDRDDTLTCVSCPPGGVPATQDVFQSLVRDPRAVQAHNRAVTDDGSMVFFTAFDALVPEDVNNGPDIYEWHDGVVKLITNGTTAYPGNTLPFVMGASPDGHDLFFVDVAQLTFDALDSAKKLYDARVDGGFAPPPPPPPPCSGDQCHGSLEPPPLLPDPGSAGLSDPGNVVPGTLSVAPVSRSQRARLARTGRLALSVRVNMGGRISASAQALVGRLYRPVAADARELRSAGTATLTLRLAKAARAQLARTGRLRLVVDVSFSQAAASRRIALTLRAPRRHASHSARRAAVPATADGR